MAVPMNKTKARNMRSKMDEMMYSYL